jgi:hypothetical protein
MSRHEHMQSWLASFEFQVSYVFCYYLYILIREVHWPVYAEVLNCSTNLGSFYFLRVSALLDVSYGIRQWFVDALAVQDGFVFG